jgi:hypothetical protein
MLTELFSIEATNMDLFWSGLVRRASEHTWNERRLTAQIYEVKNAI